MLISVKSVVWVELHGLEVGAKGASQRHGGKGGKSAKRSPPPSLPRTLGVQMDGMGP